jgi:hypothetical protein
MERVDVDVDRPGPQVMLQQFGELEDAPWQPLQVVTTRIAHGA